MNLARIIPRKSSISGDDAVEILARWGLAAIGFSYLLVAAITMKLAIAGGSDSADRQGALAKVADTGWGVPLLIVIAIGFGGYAAWRLVLAIKGERVEDDEDKPMIKRVGYAARGVFYGILTFATVRLVFTGSSSSSSGSGQEQQQAATVFSWPGGRWLVAAAGLGFIAAAIFNAYRGIARSYKDDLKTFEIPDDKERLVTIVSGFGLLARTVIFGIIGWFLIAAAVDHDPKKAIGLDGALGVLAGRPYGRVLLAVVALGLVGYAAFRFIEARYRTV